MARHTSVVINALKRDRKSGASISDLVQKYKLAKTTIWYHIQGVEMPVELARVLKARQGGSAKRSKKCWEDASTRARSILKDVDILTAWPILFAALYWSEGTKKSGFVFTNTDACMVKVFLKILREKLLINDNDLDILIRTSGTMKPHTCRLYWSKVTDISKEFIRINHNDIQNKSKTNYGICRITLRKGGEKLKIIHCLIEQIAAKMLESKPL